MTPGSPGRRARAVVLAKDGRPLGCLPPVDLPEPWWMQTSDVLGALRGCFGLDCVVLRLLGADAAPFEPGAEVTYAVEAVGALHGDLPLAPCEDVQLGDDADPRRMPWARVGGVAADVGWADRELALLGRPRTGPATQVRSWNLSLLLCLPTSRGSVWLKHVPQFFRHEGAVIELLRGIGWAATPNLLAADPAAGRILLEDVPGADKYDPDEALTTSMIRSLVTLQRRMASSCQAVLATGAPDWRATAMLQAASDLMVREDLRANLDRGENAALEALVGELPARLEALYSCGLEDTLVHGDFHQGNHRYDGHRLVLLDWTDCGVGHPLLDMAAFLARVPAEWLDRAKEVWLTEWQDAFPRADVARAAELTQAIAALRLAAVYSRFLDGIEPSEQVYHRTDPATYVRHAIALATD